MDNLLDCFFCDYNRKNSKKYKCKFCKININPKKANYIIINLNKIYFCNEKCYQLWLNKKNTN
jgi:ribosomal protein L24E